MFERFTQKARRVIFFSRYECSGLSAPALAPEHILLGLLREDRNLTQKITGVRLDMEAVRAEIAANTEKSTNAPGPLDPPLMAASKGVIALAAKESELLGHTDIGTAHLVLGLLAEDNSLAARILKAHGVTLEAYRRHVAISPSAE